MKPIIIYVTETDSDNITISKKDFEKYLQNTYSQGYTDGTALVISANKNYFYDIGRPTCNTSTQWLPQQINITQDIFKDFNSETIINKIREKINAEPIKFEK